MQARRSQEGSGQGPGRETGTGPSLGKMSLWLPWLLSCLCPACQPRSEDQALVLCLVGAPPSQGVHEPGYGKGIVVRGRPGLGQGVGR